MRDPKVVLALVLLLLSLPSALAAQDAGVPLPGEPTLARADATSEWVRTGMAALPPALTVGDSIGIGWTPVAGLVDDQRRDHTAEWLGYGTLAGAAVGGAAYMMVEFGTPHTDHSMDSLVAIVLVGGGSALGFLVGAVGAIFDRG